jgi:Mannitol-1-phosphate/altronate dehydrogenases
VGGHSVLGLLGSVHGYGTIDETVSDPLFAKYLRAFMDKEVTPNLEQLEGIDLEIYKDTLIERFANPNIKDSLSRICSESAAKLPKFLIATINENLAQGRDVSLATLVIAAWCFYSDKGEDEQGNTLEVIDAMQSELYKAAAKTTTDNLAFLSLTSLFGDLNTQSAFTSHYKNNVDALYAPASKIKAIMKNVLEPKGN